MISRKTDNYIIGTTSDWATSDLIPNSGTICVEMSDAGVAKEFTGMSVSDAITAILETGDSGVELGYVIDIDITKDILLNVTLKMENVVYNPIKLKLNLRQDVLNVAYLPEGSAKVFTKYAEEPTSSDSGFKYATNVASNRVWYSENADGNWVEGDLSSDIVAPYVNANTRGVYRAYTDNPQSTPATRLATLGKIVYNRGDTNTLILRNFDLSNYLSDAALAGTDLKVSVQYVPESSRYLSFKVGNSCRRYSNL